MKRRDWIRAMAGAAALGTMVPVLVSAAKPEMVDLGAALREMELPYRGVVNGEPGRFVQPHEYYTPEQQARHPEYKDCSSKYRNLTHDEWYEVRLCSLPIVMHGQMYATGFRTKAYYLEYREAMVNGFVPDYHWNDERSSFTAGV